MKINLKYLVFGAVLAIGMTGCGNGSSSVLGGKTSGGTGQAGTYVFTDSYHETYTELTVDTNNNVTGFVESIYTDPVSAATTTQTVTGSLDTSGNLTISGPNGLTATGYIAPSGIAVLNLKNFTVNNWKFSYQQNGFYTTTLSNSGYVGTYYSSLTPTTYKTFMLNLDINARLSGVGIDQGGDTYYLDGRTSYLGDSILGRLRSSDTRTFAFFYGGLTSLGTLSLSWNKDFGINVPAPGELQLPPGVLSNPIVSPYSGLYFGSASLGSQSGSTSKMIVNDNGDVRGLISPSLFGAKRSDYLSGSLKWDFSLKLGNWAAYEYTISRGTISSSPSGTVSGTLSTLPSNSMAYSMGGAIVDLVTSTTGTINMAKVTNPPLALIEVVPAIVTLAVGSVQQFRAIALYTDGTTTDVTAQAVWSSSTPTVAAIDATGGSATALGPGIAIVTASFGVHQGHAYLPVSTNGGPVLMYIRVMPPYPTIGVGGTQTFIATAKYSDGSSVDVTSQAVWSSATPTVATVSGGVATGVSVGTANITATFGGMSDTRPLEVTAVATKTVTSINVTATSTTVSGGGTLQMTATATYSDLTTADVTSQAAWQTSDVTLATVSSTGVLTAGNVPGIVDVLASFGGKTGSIPITIQ